MADYLMLMHDDAERNPTAPAWDTYLTSLGNKGCLRGGSAIGNGICVRRTGQRPPVTGHIIGYVKIEAESLDHALSLVAENPVYEAGGTVELRELPRTGES